MKKQYLYYHFFFGKLHPMEQIFRVKDIILPILKNSNSQGVVRVLRGVRSISLFLSAKYAGLLGAASDLLPFSKILLASLADH